ncbi:hypothetical protein HF521_022646 [Silurus meridionalis]|uniref:Chloride channel CLIC-like protein 1 n=1 Tax=Silurus meridionalis TaxID=175797 RepID=A0A8T0BAF9_SILME|nr:hypothetical protein HF521_022646 [Silurus meridionalis]
MWSVVSWFLRFKRLFVRCFSISLLWNWYYLYMIAYAEQQANLAKMENLNNKCTGVKKLDWMDNIKGEVLEISIHIHPNAVTAEIHYDAEVKLSKQKLAEIQTFVNEDNSYRTASLDDALSKVLINFKHHDYVASRKWRFEDTFVVKLDMVIKVFI